MGFVNLVKKSSQVIFSNLWTTHFNFMERPFYVGHKFRAGELMVNKEDKKDFRVKFKQTLM
jgi:hypothetical protein